MGKGSYWTSLSHSGVAFTPYYEPKGLKLGYLGQWYALNPMAEEMAYSWAKKRGTPYEKDLVFRSNFMKDFSRELPLELRDSSVETLDFTQFYSLIDEDNHRKLA